MDSGDGTTTALALRPNDILFKDGLSLAECGLTMKGVELLDDIVNRYGVVPHHAHMPPPDLLPNVERGDLVKLDWFNGVDEATGELIPMIDRHPDNIRDQASNDTNLVASCEERGVLWYMRSECWVVKSIDESKPYLAIAAGSITKAFYAGYKKMDPDDPYPMLEKTPAAKILLRCFHQQTPFEVRMFLKDRSNRFHGGSGYSCIEAMKDIIQVMSPAWELHKDDQSLTCRSIVDGQSIVMYAFFIGLPCYFDCRNHYHETERVSKCLHVAMPGWDEFQAVFNEIVDFQP